jgi:hypothetical protein
MMAAEDRKARHKPQCAGQVDLGDWNIRPDMSCKRFGYGESDQGWAEQAGDTPWIRHSTSQARVWWQSVMNPADES